MRRLSLRLCLPSFMLRSLHPIEVVGNGHYCKEEEELPLGLVGLVLWLVSGLALSTIVNLST